VGLKIFNGRVKMENRAERSVWNMALIAIMIFVGITIIAGMMGGAEVVAVAAQ